MWLLGSNFYNAVIPWVVKLSDAWEMTVNQQLVVGSYRSILHKVFIGNREDQWRTEKESQIIWSSQ